jgi:IS1 family transposase
MKEIKELMTDHWRAYTEFISETIHTQSERQSVILSVLNANYSVLLLIKYKNKELSIFS